MHSSLRLRLAVVMLGLGVAALALLAWQFLGLAQDLYVQGLQAQLDSESRLLSEQVLPLLDAGADASLFDFLAKQARKDAGVHVTIIRRDGMVLGDSDEFPASLGNLSDRPEVMQALATGHGSSERYSPTLQSDTLFVATALEHGSGRNTVVRAAAALAGLDAIRNQVAALAFVLGGGMSVMAVAVAIMLARHTTHSLAHLGRVATRLSAGDLNARTREGQPAETEHLAATMNQMADRLSATIQSLRAEQTRLADILAHMADGLLIVDAHDAVVQINRAAENILHVSTVEALNNSFTQVVRDHEMAGCLAQARASSLEQTRVIEQSRTRRFLRMVATPLPLAGSPPTFLVVLQDLTQIRRLETVRRDFISNISHELRTPLASVQALVETLNDGALEDLPQARRFVARMEEEVHHLTRLVNNLLDLSVLESGRAPLRRTPVDIGAILHNAAQRLEQQAERAEVALRVDAAPIILVSADAERIEQVILNVIQNAIKFTPAGGQIDCRAVARDTHVAVSVRDTGVGISAANLPRIFERFYKTDRSRAGGGTGLGLAIARHVVELHGGHIWAESVEGHGTTMIFTLPLVSENPRHNPYNLLT